MTTTISGNMGGGVDVGGGSSFTLTNSTASGNTSGSVGGGIFNRGTLNIFNSTVSGNVAAQKGGGIESNGALQQPASVNVYNATISDNQANGGFGMGGGIDNGALSSFNFQNTILAGNFEGIFAGECRGTINSNGFNLMNNYDTSNCTIIGTAPTLADPGLRPLANYGGPTQTHALKVGSPAIDAGTGGGCRDNLGALLTTDQRGFRRPVNGGVNGVRCDIGAYEYYRVSLFLPLIRK